MPRAKKDEQRWETALRATVNSSFRYWGVQEHSGKVRLRVQYPKGQGLPPKQQVSLPFPWAAESLGPVTRLCDLIYRDVHEGKKTLQAALNDVIAKSDAKQNDPENWPQIVEQFHRHVTESGNKIKEKTFHASYGRYFEVVLELLKGSSPPNDGQTLLQRVLIHQRYNRKPGKKHGEPLALWQDQPASRQECALAIKKLTEFAVHVCHQPQSWLVNPFEYAKLRGARQKAQRRAVLEDDECLKIFAELAQEAPDWIDVARVMRVFGIRPWEMNHLVVKKNWEGEERVFCTKGKTFTSKGVKRSTEPRFLEAIPVAGEQFDLLERIKKQDLRLPKGKDGAPVKISGKNFGSNLRRTPLWRHLVQEKARLGEELVPYSFRHTYSARCTNLGIDTDDASMAMGHTAEVHRRIYRTSTQRSVTSAFKRAREQAATNPQL
jgi:integrase